MKTYDELKQEQKPVGTFDCYTSDFCQYCEASTVTIFKWEQVPRSKTKTRVPRYKSWLKVKCDRENWESHSRLIQDAVDVLNAANRGNGDYPEPPPPKITDKPMKQRGF